MYVEKMHKKQMHFLYLSILTSISYFRTHQRVQGRGDALLVSLWQFHVPLFVTQIRSICPYLLSLWQPFFLERNEFPFWLDLEREKIDISSNTDGNHSYPKSIIHCKFMKCRALKKSHKCLFISIRGNVH